ncbi:MAG TPA: HAMP domain-containing sensor histidine kinase [Polyangiales bacterium]|nr:HAMP domain-containing sensor histidine kinase [Polyangiales bacterium]
MTRRARGALVWRLYAIGIVQLALVVVAALAIAVLSHTPPWLDLENMRDRIVARVGKPKELDRLLSELRSRQVDVSLYDSDRVLIASNVKPPLPATGALDQPSPGPQPTRSGLPPLPALLPGLWPHPHGRDDRGPPGDDDRAPGHERRFTGRVVFAGPPRHGGPPLAYVPLALPDGDGLLVARFPPPKPSALPPLLALGFGLVVIFVGAFLTARWIGRPLEQLTRAARALGQGDLRARTAIARKDELGELGRTFDDMAERMEQLLLAEKELLANVAHELRTPLARIRVALEIAVEGDAEAARASLAEIAVDLAELEALINDVLTATRFELTDGRASESGFALHRECLPARALAERAVERFASHHPLRKLELELPGGRDAQRGGEPELSELPELPNVEVDRVLFRRVLDNLLDNAHKYTPDPSLPIVLRVAREGQHAIFEVRDHGIGIPEADLPHVFSAFFRSERSRSRGTGGVGLGLTLVKRIVEAHGGTVRIASSPGAGTTVRVSVAVAVELTH